MKNGRIEFSISFLEPGGNSVQMAMSNYYAP